MAIKSVTKPKLPKGLAYALKTSVLEEALADAGLDCHVDLDYWKPQGGGSILEAHYWLPNENVPYPRVYVRAGVVPAAERFAASAALNDVVLPAFVGWLTRIVALPDSSPELHQVLYFNATYSEDDVAITNQPVYKVPRRRR